MKRNEQVQKIKDLLNEYNERVKPYGKHGIKLFDIFVGSKYVTFKVDCYYTSEFYSVVQNFCASSWSLDKSIHNIEQVFPVITSQFVHNDDGNDHCNITIGGVKSYDPIIDTLEMSLRRIETDLKKELRANYEDDDD